jgi:2,4-dienoyl-CoA reductase (NADPH2)
VVGAGPAGLAAAVTAAKRGHKVSLYDAANEIGGQFNLARRIPGKEEYAQTIRYFSSELSEAGVMLRLGMSARAEELIKGGFDHVVIATGVRPRKLSMPGIDLPGVVNYVELIEGRVDAGPRVAVIGAGGIGFDVAELLTHEDLGVGDEIEHFASTWGIDFTVGHRGGLVPPAVPHVTRRVWLLQRKEEGLGRHLGKTTGWIRRSLLGRRGVQMWPSAKYERIDRDNNGLRLHLYIRDEPRVLEVDNIVICAGQDPEASLVAPLQAAGVETTAIGGARLATELDAVRAIEEGMLLGARL